LLSSGFSAAFFKVEAAFLAVVLGLEAADLVRGVFFFWGEGAAGLGAEALAFSCGREG
jgi:hypothetical protein